MKGSEKNTTIKKPSMELLLILWRDWILENIEPRKATLEVLRGFEGDRDNLFTNKSSHAFTVNMTTGAKFNSPGGFCAGDADSLSTIDALVPDRFLFSNFMGRFMNGEVVSDFKHFNQHCKGIVVQKEKKPRKASKKNKTEVTQEEEEQQADEDDDDDDEEYEEDENGNKKKKRRSPLSPEEKLASANAKASKATAKEITATFRAFYKGEQLVDYSDDDIQQLASILLSVPGAVKNITLDQKTVATYLRDFIDTKDPLCKFGDIESLPAVYRPFVKKAAEVDWQQEQKRNAKHLQQHPLSFVPDLAGVPISEVFAGGGIHQSDSMSGMDDHSEFTEESNNGNRDTKRKPDASAEELRKKLIKKQKTMTEEERARVNALKINDTKKLSEEESKNLQANVTSTGFDAVQQVQLDSAINKRCGPEPKIPDGGNHNPETKSDDLEKKKESEPTTGGETEEKTEAESVPKEKNDADKTKEQNNFPNGSKPDSETSKGENIIDNANDVTGHHNVDDADQGSQWNEGLHGRLVITPPEDANNTESKNDKETPAKEEGINESKDNGVPMEKTDKMEVDAVEEDNAMTENEKETAAKEEETNDSKKKDGFPDNTGEMETESEDLPELDQGSSHGHTSEEETYDHKEKEDVTDKAPNEKKKTVDNDVEKDDKQLTPC